MENYIMLGIKKIEISNETAKNLKEEFCKGETFGIGSIFKDGGADKWMLTFVYTNKYDTNGVFNFVCIEGEEIGKTYTDNESSKLRGKSSMRFSLKKLTKNIGTFPLDIDKVIERN